MMTDPAPAAGGDTDLLARMLCTWQRALPGAISGMALALAKAGDLVALQRIGEGGALALAKTSEGRPDMSVFCAVLVYARLQPGASAAALEVQWSKAMGGVTAADCQRHLGMEGDPGTVVQLLARGAHPNRTGARADAPRQSALGCALEHGRMDAVMAMLDYLEAGQARPLVEIDGAGSDGTTQPGTMLFTHIADDKFPIASYTSDLSKRLVARGIPGAWRRDCGAAMSLLAASRQLGDPRMKGMPGTWPHLLTLAEFDDPTQWIELLSRGDGRVTDMLSQHWENEQPDRRPQVLANVLAGGVHPDAPHSRLDCAEHLEATWLHSAIYHGHLVLTRMLLESGADPRRRTRPASGEGKSIYAGCNAFELADLRAEVDANAGLPNADREAIRILLGSWRALQALRAAIDQPHAHAPAAAGRGQR